MVGYLISGLLALAVVCLSLRLLFWKRRLGKLSGSMEDYLSQGGHPAPYSLREDALAPVENAASELENRIALLEERCRQEGERSSRLTADISHQLKTPLASLRLFCELDNGEHLAGQLGQIERMEKLIGSLLRLEKLCADGYEFSFAEQSLAPLVENVWRELHPLWPDRELSIVGNAVLRCDSKWLGEAFQNLLKNACEHTGESGRIRLKIEKTEHTVYCTLEDDGGGVAEKDLPHLFERFYRAEGQSQNGSGLGLAIVKEIVFRHHGHIRAKNTEKGLQFDLSFPVLNLTKS